MKISDIAKRCGYEFCGEDIEVDSLRLAEHAGDNSIAVINKPECIVNIKARSILVQPMLLNTDKSIIFAADPLECASVKIARILQEERAQHSQQVKYRLQDNFYLAENVTIGDNTFIGPNVCIDNDVVIGNDCYISANTHIGSGVIIKNGVKIGDGTTVGADSFYHYYDDGLQEFEGLGIVIIEDNVSIGNKTIIQRGTFSDTIIGARSRIGNLIDIGHDVVIGHDCKIVSQTGIASNVIIKDYVTIYGQVGVSNNVCIGEKAVVYAKSLVTKDVIDNQCVSGIYAHNHVEELRIQAKLRKL